MLTSSQIPVKAGTQFILKSTPPEKEKRFQELKREHNGSFWAWHGSVRCIMNEFWVCLIRQALTQIIISRLWATGTQFFAMA